MIIKISIKMKTGEEYIYNNQAEAIIEARVKAGLTQKDVANKIGIAVSNYQKYEYGERTPKAQLLEKLAKVLNVDIDVLWCIKYE